MSVIITGEALKGALEAVKNVTDAIDKKASQAQTTANSALTAAQNAQSTATQASQAASTADAKATNAASAAATADGKAVQAQTTANSALSAAQTAQSTADGKQSKLYHHIILMYGGTLIVNVINTKSNAYVMNDVNTTTKFNNLIASAISVSYYNTYANELGVGLPNSSVDGEFDINVILLSDMSTDQITNNIDDISDTVVALG